MIQERSVTRINLFATVINIYHGSDHDLAPDKVQKGISFSTNGTECTLTPDAITIPAGQRTGTTSLAVS